MSVSDVVSKALAKKFAGLPNQCDAEKESVPNRQDGEIFYFIFDTTHFRNCNS